MILAIVNHKGGVGKTTTTLNLGKALSLLGKKTLIIDIDPQSNLSQSVGIEQPEKNIYQVICNNENLPIQKLSENLEIVPADLDLSEAELRLQADVNGFFKLRTALNKVKENYDFVLIDCPPSLGILTANAMIAAQKVVVVVQSQYLAVKGLQTILELIERLRENLNPNLEVLGMLVTQTNRTTFSKSIEATVREVYQGRVFETSIRQNVALAEASSQAKNIFEYASKSSGAEDYMNLAKEVLAIKVYE